MSPDNSKQQPYAIVKLEEAARSIRQAVKELPVLRKRLDKFKENKFKAREVYNDLQQQRSKVLAALSLAVLSLQEMELPDLADYSVKLGHSIQSFNLMTPDYTKLCGVLSGYLAKLPIDGTPEMETTNAAIIGRLMASVKTGYYPTDVEHIEHLIQGVVFPEGVTAVNANLKMSVFAEKECHFSPGSIQVYTALTTISLVGLKPVKP